MSYEIKTIYRAVVPGFEWGGYMHQGWYWDHATAERVITQDGGARHGQISESDAIVMGDGSVLWAHPAEDSESKTVVTEIRVYGDTDEELRDAALARLPDNWKVVLGLPHDPEVAAKQTFLFSKGTEPWLRDKLLVLDVTAEEARVLGLAEDRDKAIENFEATTAQLEREAEARRDHPLVGRKFEVRVPHRAGGRDTLVEYRVEEKLLHDAEGDVELRCSADQMARLFSVRSEDEMKIWRASEIREMLGEGEAAHA